MYLLYVALRESILLYVALRESILLYVALRESILLYMEFHCLKKTLKNNLLYKCANGFSADSRFGKLSALETVNLCKIELVSRTLQVAGRRPEEM